MRNQQLAYIPAILLATSRPGGAATQFQMIPAGRHGWANFSILFKQSAGLQINPTSLTPRIVSTLPVISNTDSTGKKTRKHAFDILLAIVGKFDSFAVPNRPFPSWYESTY